MIAFKVSSATETMKEEEANLLFHELPYQPVGPYDLTEEIISIIQSDWKKKRNRKIIQLINKFFEIETVCNSIVLLEYIIEYTQSIELVEMIFYQMPFTSHHSLAVYALKLLLDHGLPIDDYFNRGAGTYVFNLVKGHTPLHHCIIMKLLDCVKLLLDRGADMEKTSSARMTPLEIAVRIGDESILKLLLQKGAKVNEKNRHGSTALHIACGYEKNHTEIIKVLLDHGADLNILNDKKETALEFCQVHENEFILIKELAKLRFSRKPVCHENLEFLLYNAGSRASFKICLNELQRLKEHKIYNHLSLYDVLKKEKQLRKMSLLLKNEEFVSAFKTNWDCNSFKCYAQDIYCIFDKAIRIKDFIHSEEKKIYESGLDEKFHLPHEMIRKIVYLMNEHLFFQKL